MHQRAYIAGKLGLRALLAAGQSLVIRADLRLQNVKLEGHVQMNGWPYVLNLGELIIADAVKITSSRANPVAGHVRTSLVVQRSGSLKIGRAVGMSNCEMYCSKSIEIGTETLIGGGVRIYDTDFHSITAAARRSRPDHGARSAAVIIGSECFIGAYATLLKGTVVGDRSVVGAGSVVSGPIPADEVWAGNPARFVKKLPLG